MEMTVDDYFFGMRYNHPFVGYHPHSTFAPSTTPNDVLILDACDLFIKRVETGEDLSKGRIWDTNVNLHKDIVQALQKKDLDYLRPMFANMCRTPLTQGVGFGEEYAGRLIGNPFWRKTEGHSIYDKLLSLLEVVGATALFNAEEYFYLRHVRDVWQTDINILLDALFEKIGVVLPAPANLGGAFGLETKYGIYTERDFLSMAVALDIRQNFDDTFEICEIGGGIGHLAYYLNLLGFENYTIVDIPTISVLQKYFLSDNLPNHKIKLLTPAEFTGRYDLVVNVDSLTEMSIEDASRYVNLIAENGNYFISINTEINDFYTRDICDSKMTKIYRQPWYMRRGYIHEEYVA